MNIAYSYFFPQHDDLKHYARQLGIRKAVTNTESIAGSLNRYTPEWSYAPLFRVKQEMNSYGLEFAVLEGVNFIDSAKLGLPDRDEAIAHFCTLLENLSKLGVKTVCYNWMPIWGWFRTHPNIPLEGGATATGFEYDACKDFPVTDFGLLKADALWSNLEYFLKKVVPAAEKYKVQLAIHPDDPPVPTLGGIDRILTSAHAMEQVTKLVPSEYNGITLCQGTFVAMGEDIPTCIRRFGKNGTLFFAHFRDLSNNSYEQFHETFHHTGITDMYACMKAYYEVNFDGCIRPDHVPTMYKDSNAHPGYGNNGNLLATGYMLGLMEAAQKEMGTRNASEK